MGGHWLKKLAWNLFQASSVNSTFLRQLSTRDGSNDDGGGGNKPGAHRTSSTRDPCNSCRTDMTGSIHMDNTRIRSPDSRSHKSYIGKPGNQIQLQPLQFPLKCERQNAARERKQIHLPSMQLREAFSCSSPFVFVVLRGIEAPCQGFPRRLRIRVSLCVLNRMTAVARLPKKEAKNGAVYRPNTSQRNSSLVSLVGNGWAIAWLRNIQSKRASDQLGLVAE